MLIQYSIDLLLLIKLMKLSQVSLNNYNLENSLLKSILNLVKLQNPNILECILEEFQKNLQVKKKHSTGTLGFRIENLQMFCLYNKVQLFLHA